MSEPLTLFLWYTVSQETKEGFLSIPRQQLHDWLNELGIPCAGIPPAGRPADAWRAATGQLEGSYEVPMRDRLGRPVQVRARLEVGDERVTSGYVRRRLFKVWTDPRSGEEHVDRVADLQFMRPKRDSESVIRGTERLRCVVGAHLSEPDASRVRAQVSRLPALYRANMDRVTAQQMRWLIRARLADAGAIPLREGVGAVFILPPRDRHKVEGLRELILRLHSDIQLRITSGADEPDVRQMMIGAVDEDIQRRSRNLVRDLKDWLSTTTGYPRTTRLQEWQGRVDLMREQLLDYSELLGVTFPEAAEALETAIEHVAGMHQLRRPA